MSKKYSRLRDELIDKASKDFGRRVKQWEKLLWELILDQYMASLETDEKGNLVLTAANIRKITIIDKIRAKTEKEFGQKLAGEFVQQLYKLFDLNTQYFASLSTLPTFEQVTAVIRNKLSLALGIGKKGATVPGGYIETLFGLANPMSVVKKEALKAIAAGQSRAEFEKVMAFYIRGGSYRGHKKQGLIQAHMRTWAYDAYAQFDRLAGYEYAMSIGLKYAQYTGGLIETSRPFCIARNRKVFHIDEIRSWIALDFTGKPPNYDPIRDCGGFNCRHKLNWTTDEDAEYLKAQEDKNFEKAKQRRAELKEILVKKQEEIINHPDVPEPIHLVWQGYKEALNQPHKHMAEKNEAILSISKLIQSGTFLSFVKDTSAKSYGAYYLRTTIAGSPSYILLKKRLDGKVIFYSIVDKLKKAPDK